MAYDFASGKGIYDSFLDLKVWERTFCLHPTLWRNLKTTHKLNWTPVRFTDKNRKNVPEDRGIYAFVVQHDNSVFPPHGYLMYIGITGHTSDKRNLRVRYGDYLRDRSQGGRSKIVSMLQAFQDDLLFYYVRIPDRRLSLEKLEDELLDVLIPPCNEKFSANIAPAVRALR